MQEPTLQAQISTCLDQEIKQTENQTQKNRLSAALRILAKPANDSDRVLKAYLLSYQYGSDHIKGLLNNSLHVPITGFLTGKDKYQPALFGGTQQIPAPFKWLLMAGAVTITLLLSPFAAIPICLLGMIEIVNEVIRLYHDFRATDVRYVINASCGMLITGALTSVIALIVSSSVLTLGILPALLLIISTAAFLTAQGVRLMRYLRHTNDKDAADDHEETFNTAPSFIKKVETNRAQLASQQPSIFSRRYWLLQETRQFLSSCDYMIDPRSSSSPAS